MTQKVVGILGGMGPESTVDLLQKIIRGTPIEREQDHLRIVIDNNPKVPDRTEALVSGDTANAVAILTETARTLESTGAELIGMPCNTAHAFLAEIRASVGVPVLDMIDESAKRALELFGTSSVMGLLATDGTVLSRLYHDAMERRGIGVMTPRGDLQSSVMNVTTEVKRSGVSPGCLATLSPAVDDVADQGAAVLIAGCTEISLVLAAHSPRLPWLDPLEVLAERLIEMALSRGSSRRSG